MTSSFQEHKFGTGMGYRLCNDRIKNTILDKLKRYYKLNLHDHRLMGLNKHIKQLCSDVIEYQHLISFHLTCPLSYLYLTEYNGLCYCYYILTSGNNVEVISTIQRFDKELFQKDTMFSGYICNDIFLVEDIVIKDGHTFNKPLEERIKTINLILDYQYTRDPIMDNYRIVLKDYVEYCYLQSFVTEYLNKLDYKDKVDGIVFSPLGNSVIHYIMQINLISMHNKQSLEQEDDQRFNIIKDPKCDKACFLVRTTEKPDVFHLYLSTGKVNKYYDIASVPDRTSSMYMKHVFRNSHELIMICKYDKRGHIQRWQPIMVSNRDTPDTIYRLHK